MYVTSDDVCHVSLSVCLLAWIDVSICALMECNVVQYVDARSCNVMQCNGMSCNLMYCNGMIGYGYGYGYGDSTSIRVRSSVRILVGYGMYSAYTLPIILGARELWNPPQLLSGATKFLRPAAVSTDPSWKPLEETQRWNALCYDPNLRKVRVGAPSFG